MGVRLEVRRFACRTRGCPRIPFAQRFPTLTHAYTRRTLRQADALKHGEIPSNITVDGQQVSYGHLTGRVDATLWYIIGVCALLNHTKRSSQKVRFWLSVERALNLAGCWEYNDRGFIYTPISGNWADEYMQQGYV